LVSESPVASLDDLLFFSFPFHQGCCCRRLIIFPTNLLAV
jgi:hypothetical protein